MNDIQITTNSFVQVGGLIFSQLILAWNLEARGIEVRTNVTTPQAMPKLSAVINPMPYRGQDDAGGNGAKYTDRVLTAYQSKVDFDFDPEDFRNKYLAKMPEMPFYEAANTEVSKKIFGHLSPSNIIQRGKKPSRQQCCSHL